MPNILSTEPIDIVGLISRGNLEIPKYQRSYSWTKREIAEFLEDLFGAAQHTESWFLGIVYTYNSVDESTHAKKKTSTLLDGQQRMTTLFILLKELTLYSEIIQDTDTADKIRDFAAKHLTSLVFLPATDTPRLTLDDANKEQFAQYLQGDTRETASFGFYKGGEFAKSHELLNEAIKEVRKWLDKDCDNARGRRDEFENFKRIVSFILNDIEIIEIALNRAASFYNIFESINDRGRRLTDSDKFKNRYCSLIPQTQIPQFESDWFNTAKGVYSLGKDLDKDLFDFYFRSTGVDDLKSEGFYRTLRNKIQAKKGDERIEYIVRVWDEIKDMHRFSKAIESLDLIKLYKGTAGNNLLTISKVINVLVRHAWNSFDQYGVIAYALFRQFTSRADQEAFTGFLRDLLNGVRFYIGAFLSGEGANTIRNYTIEVAKGLTEGGSLSEILDSNDARLDFGGKYRANPLDSLSISNNGVSQLLLTLVQAHVNREVIEHYDANQNWTLEHLVPKKWSDRWAGVAQADWGAINEEYRQVLNRQLQAADLEDTNKLWIQELLGNKWVLSWKQNNKVKNESLTEKKAQILNTEGGVILPTLSGKNLSDYSSFGVKQIIDRTAALGAELEKALNSRDLP